MKALLPAWLQVHPEVRQALESRRPVVGLESAVITHGLPRPINLELARRMEAEVRKAGGTPATTAVLGGVLRLGVTADELEAFALDLGAVKVSRRDLAPTRIEGLSGGTTVSAAIFIAAAAGVRILATGGIGGVHRGQGGDVSSDLLELSRTPVGVVCSGAKAILDLPRTLEWLETGAVLVVGYQTSEFPAFYAQGSGLAVSTRVDTPPEAAQLLRSHWELGPASGALICVPCPESDALPKEEVEQAVGQAEREAEAQGVRGPALSPFLLNRVSELSNGRALKANLALLRNNARVAAEIAVALG
ncbi:MAG: pseudouridine-5'-phosphate glycosidase [Anaerolineales bacterium]